MSDGRQTIDEVVAQARAAVARTEEESPDFEFGKAYTAEERATIKAANEADEAEKEAAARDAVLATGEFLLRRIDDAVTAIEELVRLRRERTFTGIEDTKGE